MIQKLHVLIDNKLVLNKFLIKIQNNNLIIESIDLKNNIVQVPVYNKYNGLDYFPISFPLKLPIVKNYVFNHYLILSTYNLLIDNELDFFYQIEKTALQYFKLSWIKLDQTLDDKFNLSKIINDNYDSSKDTDEEN